MKIACAVAVTLAALADAGCVRSPTYPSEDRLLDSALGFHIQAMEEFLEAGGAVTPAHAELADVWWGHLMRDLASAGMAAADPTNIRGYVGIRLRQPRTPEGHILYQDEKTLVGGYYSRLDVMLYVPGDYPTANWLGRINSQPLKHEMLHHWCYAVLKKDCMPPGMTGFEPNSHVWPAPNGVNVWDYTWQ